MFGTYTDHIPQMSIFYQIHKKLFRYVRFYNQFEQHLGPWLVFRMCFHELFCIPSVQTSQEIDFLSESRPLHQCYYKKINAICNLTDICKHKISLKILNRTILIFLLTIWFSDSIFLYLSYAYADNTCSNVRMIYVSVLLQILLKHWQQASREFPLFHLRVWIWLILI